MLEVIRKEAPAYIKPGMFTAPVIFFDLETTGTDPVVARIAQLAACKLTPVEGGYIYEVLKTLVNPTVPMPLEASEVNHLTDEMLRDAPKFSDIATDLHKFFEGCDLGGYNSIKYDMVCLIEEFNRAGLSFKYGQRKLYDSFALFCEKFPRNLTTAMSFYCNVDNFEEQAHDALADTEASMQVLVAQMEKYEMSAEDAHKLLADKRIDLKGQLKRKEDGSIVFGFGKYLNRQVKEVCNVDPGYIQWILGNTTFAADTRKHIELIRRGIEK